MRASDLKHAEVKIKMKLKVILFGTVGLAKQGPRLGDCGYLLSLQQLIQ
jgi:hypothetical protein